MQSTTLQPEGQTPLKAVSSAGDMVLHISVIGGIAMSYRGAEVRVRNRKSKALLSYLALRQAPLELRERIVGLFWSEADEANARGSLRQTLRELRDSFDEVAFDGFWSDRLEIGFDRGRVTIDLMEVLLAVESGQVHPLILNTSRIADRLFEGYDDLDPEFRGWLLAKRQTFHDRLLRGLEELLAVETDRDKQKQIAVGLLALDPTHESACRYVMQLRAQEGDVSGALKAYRSLWTLLDEEYGQEPTPVTESLVAAIKLGRVGMSPEARIDAGEAALPTAIERALERGRLAQPTLSQEGKMALLIGAFSMNGVDPDKLHLVQGFRHHLIASLIRFREWYVAEATPEAENQGGETKTYGVEATAYQAGDELSLILTLRSGASYIWSETIRLDLKTWFQLQQRVVRQIAIALNVQVSMERLKRLASEPDVSLDVYDRWLRGQQMSLRFSAENWERAARIFSDMVEEAPRFSSGYSSLVQMSNAVHIVHPGIHRDPQKARQTLELAKTAVQLDPVDSRAQLCLGWANAMVKQYAQADAHMELACDLNENNPWTPMSAALYYAFTGKIDRARALANEAMELAFVPSLTHWAYLVSVRYFEGDFTGAIDASDRANNVIRTMPAWRAAALHHLGQREKAIVEGQRFLNSIRGFWFGAGPPTDLAIGRWMLHLFPISQRDQWEHLRDGLRGAGIPVDGAEHHAW